MNKKNQLKLWMMGLLLAIVAPTLQSCDDDDDDYGRYMPNALVTLKTQEGDDAFYLQLDDKTTLWPSNIKQHPYKGKEVRALVNFTYEKQVNEGPQSVFVNWIDTIRTKPMAIDMGEENDNTYGTDPLELVKDWVTVVEDGYLTIRFRTLYTGNNVHVLNLVKGEKDYEVILHHDAQGDTQGYMSDGMIAFRLDKLPDTERETVNLTVKWNSFSGEKSTTFKYCTRK